MVQVQPQQESSPGPNIAEAFIADRQLFWQRFMTFTTGTVVVLVVLLIAMWLFIV